MKNLIWPVLITTILHNGFSYFWLLIANSESPLPGKQIILGSYLLIVLAIFWRFKTFKEIGLFSILTGLLAGITSLIVVGIYFPGVFHEMDFGTDILSILLKGSLIFIFLYFILGLIVCGFKKVFKVPKNQEST